MSSGASIQVTYTGTRAPRNVPDALALRHAPLLEVTPVDLHVERLERLTATPTGLVVFSKNAVRSIRDNGAHRALAPFDRHTWWAVGEKTADFLHREFGVRARYPVDQCFEGLQLEFEHANLPNSVLAFTLEGTSRDLSPVLDERGIDYHQLDVYRTEAADFDDLDALLDGADWVVFASAKSIGALFRAAESPDEALERLDETRVATIGPKTARAARKRDIDVDFVPSEPDVDLLLRDIADRTRANPPPNSSSTHGPDS